MNTTYLKSWQSAWHALGQPGAPGADEALLGDLVRRYEEPHRKYHTMQHLDECFANFALARAAADHPAEIEIALWFHDAIYELKRQDNERKCAEWARAEVLKRGAAAAAERVYSLVMVTCHNALPQTQDEKLLVDIDLAILGASPARFDEYEQQVRDEYGWVPGFLFRPKRRSILQEFLGRPSLYNTEFFVTRLEAQARSNLRRSIESLS